jgi:isoquinoline 1-oxidoreductase beta subunit
MKATRREFLKRSSVAGAGLCLVATVDQVYALREDVPLPFRPNAFIQITPNNEITFFVTRCEMGQGVRTLLPLLLAEELEVDPRKVKLIQPHTAPEFKGIRLRTSGSGSAAGTWNPLRRGGAAAREMLIAAAAQQWGVDASACRAENGNVLHDASGKKASYGELANAAAKIAVPQEPKIKTGNYKLVGGRHKRIDSEAIVTGKLPYGIDFRADGMKVAVVARSPVLGGKVKSFDAAAAKQVPGVRDFVPVTVGFANGIAVIADNTWAAMKGRDLLKVTWDPGQHAAFSTEKHIADHHAALQKPGQFVTREEGKLSGDADFVAEYEWPYQAHAPLEPMNCTAHVANGKCTIWAPTQAPEASQTEAAKLLGFKPEDVMVHALIMGGGFGRRLYIDYVLEAVEVAKQVSYPVQVLWTRADDMQHGSFNPTACHRFAVTLDARKRPSEWLHRATDNGLTNYPKSTSAAELAEGYTPWGGYDNPYRFGAMRVEFSYVDSPVPTGPWRAVAYPSTVFGRESFIDELAHNARVDPIDLRLELLQPLDTVTLGELKLDRAKLSRVLEAAREKSGWKTPFGSRDGRKRGRGIACNIYHGQTHLAQVAEVSVGAQGDVRVEKITSVIDLGQPLNMLGVEGQVESAIIWALSSTVKSSMSFKSGEAQSSNFVNYPVVRMNDTPVMETHVLPSTERPSGLGEQPVPCVAPAIANAIFAATGKRIRKVPILLV